MERTEFNRDATKLLRDVQYLIHTHTHTFDHFDYTTSGL